LGITRAGPGCISREDVNLSSLQSWTTLSRAEGYKFDSFSIARLRLLLEPRLVRLIDKPLRTVLERSKLKLQIDIYGTCFLSSSLIE
jgi:hypothetical protein